MINATALRKKLSGMSVEELVNECLNLSYFVSNCNDTLQGKKCFGAVVSGSSLVCKEEAISLMENCRNIASQKRQHKLNFLNQVINHG